MQAQTESNKLKLTHGSLFTGVGGFDDAADDCGIETLWSCEIEPYQREIF